MKKSLSNSALRAHLGIALKGLQEALRGFTRHIEFNTRDAWVWQRPRGKTDPFGPLVSDLSRERTLEVMVDAITAIKYTDDQDPHESHIAPGAIALSRDGIALADEVNRHKRELASVLRAMQGRTEIGVIDQRTGQQGPRPLREVALEGFFFRRLHHWQATRELIVLRESAHQIRTPEYIGFSWATCRDVRRTTREKLLEQIKASRAAAEHSPLFDHDIAKLYELEPGEPLALVRPGHTTPKANVAWPSLHGGPPVRQIRPAVLPLILLGDRLPARLRKLPAAPTPRHFRLSRTDTEIEPAPLLETLPAHRYLPHVLPQKRAEAAQAAT